MPEHPRIANDVIDSFPDTIEGIRHPIVTAHSLLDIIHDWGAGEQCDEHHAYKVLAACDVLKEQLARAHRNLDHAEIAIGRQLRCLRNPESTAE